MKRFFVAFAMILVLMSTLSNFGTCSGEESVLLDMLEDYAIFQSVQVKIQGAGNVEVVIHPKLIDSLTLRNIYDIAYAAHMDGTDNITIYDYGEAASAANDEA